MALESAITGRLTWNGAWPSPNLRHANGSKKLDKAISSVGYASHCPCSRLGSLSVKRSSSCRYSFQSFPSYSDRSSKTSTAFHKHTSAFKSRFFFRTGGLQSVKCSVFGQPHCLKVLSCRRKSLSQGRRPLVQGAYISPPAPADLSHLEGEGRDVSPQEPDSESPSPLATNIPGASRGAPEPVLTWRLIIGLLLKERARLAVAALGLIGGTTCTIVMPQFSGRFFETLIGKRSGQVSTLVLCLAGVYLLEPCCTVLYVTSLVTAWEKVMEQLRSRVFSRLIVQKVEFFDRHNVGELTSLLSTELGSIEKMVNENVSRDRGFRSLSEVLLTLVILWCLSKDLAPAFAFLMIGISAGVGLYKRQTAPVFRKHAGAQARIIACANETFSAIRTVRSFGGERRQMSMFEEQVAASRASGTRLGLLKSANEAWTRMAVYVSLLAVYLLGGAKVKAGQLPVGTMVAFIGYTFTLTFAVQGLVNTLADLRSVLAAVERVNRMTSSEDFDTSLEVGLERAARGEVERCAGEDAAASAAATAGASAGTAATAAADGSAGARNAAATTAGEGMSRRPSSSVCELAWSGDVVLEDVRFSYPQRPDTEILKGISLRLPRGTVTALVGASGAGKSTVVQLLSRFYEPSGGRITLAGQDVRLFDKAEWARAVALVNQEPVLFAMSVRDNIAYGLPNDEVTDEEVEAAARAANAHEFVEKLPQGYATMVGERGSLLSGGQRQRVAIARALLKNAPILILDEATSALDSVSERLVQQALERLMKGRTTLVIAHRLSTVQSANQIAVVSAGEVIELGSHNELVGQGGAYADLVNSQRLSFE